MRRQNGEDLHADVILLTLTQYTHYYSVYSKYIEEVLRII